MTVKAVEEPAAASYGLHWPAVEAYLSKYIHVLLVLH